MYGSHDQQGSCAARICRVASSATLFWDGAPCAVQHQSMRSARNVRTLSVRRSYLHMLAVSLGTEFSAGTDEKIASGSLS